MLWRMRHGLLEKRLVIAARLDEALVQLSEFVLLLRVFANQLNQLWPNRKRRVVQLRNLFIVAHVAAAALRARAQQRKQLLDIAYLRKHLALHLRLALELVGRRVLELFDIIEREDARFAAQ